MQIPVYILMATGCLSLFYIAYRLIFSKERNFRQLRLYLMGSVLFSLLIPLSRYSIELRTNDPKNILLLAINQPQQTADQIAGNRIDPVADWSAIALKVYYLVSLVLICRILLQVIILIFNYIKSTKIRHVDCVLILNHRFRSTFSFFRLIFVAPGSISKEDMEQIIAHERIHALQYHSFDLIMIELLAAVMWFNPLIWMMRNSIQLVHEYLADEGALGTGIDKYRYQALLINQVTEERLICLSSSFNHSLIKKRMKMMTNNNTNCGSKLKILTLIPLSISLFLLTACVNGLFATEINERPIEINDGSVLSEGTFQDVLLDTIKKKTVGKIIHTNTWPDTVITESYFVAGPDGEINTITIVKKGNPDDIEDIEMEIQSPEDNHNEHSGHVSHSTNVDVEVNRNNDNQNKVTTMTKMEIRNTGDFDRSKILYIIDGVEHLEKDPISGLDPEKINSIEVFKGDKIKEYTDKDFDGVIIIKTKDGKK